MSKITADSFYHGRVRIYQHKKGYRFSLDAVLLAAWVERVGQCFLELGCGNGAVSLMLAYRYPGVSITGVDLQFPLLKLFSLSVRENRFPRVFPVAGDVRKPPFRQKFDVVFANPPYQSPLRGRVSPYPEIALSRFEIAGSLKDFVTAAYQLLSAEGKAYFIVGAERKEDFNSYCHELGFWIEEELFALPERNKPAVFYLAKLSFEKARRKTLPPVILKEKGKYTPQMEKVFEGADLREVLYKAL